MGFSLGPAPWVGGASPAGLFASTNCWRTDFGVVPREKLLLPSHICWQGEALSMLMPCSLAMHIFLCAFSF